MAAPIRPAPATLAAPLIAVLVFAAALAPRLAFLRASPDRDWPHNTCYEGDAPLWAECARALGRGESFELGLPIHPPAMGYLLYLLGVGDGRADFHSIKLFFCAIGAASCTLIVLVGRGPLPTGQAAAAAILSAASFPLVVQTTSLNGETPYTLLLLSGLLLTRLATARPTPARLALLGVSHGLAVLFRPEHTLLVILTAAYLVWAWSSARQKPRPPAAGGRCAQPGMARRWRSARALAVMLLLFALVPLPWNVRSYYAIRRFNGVAPASLHVERAEVPWTDDAVAFLRALPAFAREVNFNYITYLARQRGLPRVTRDVVERFFGDEMGYVPQPLSPFTFVSNQGPLAFALANHAGADGSFSTALLENIGPQKLAFGHPRHLQLVQHGYAIGIRNLADHPARAARLLVRKLALFIRGWTGGFSPANVPLGIGGIRRPVDQLTSDSPVAEPWAVAVLLVAAIGMFEAWRRRIGGLWLLVIVYKLLVALAFFGYARQAVSILPVFYLFVVLGASALFRTAGNAVRRRRLSPAETSRTGETAAAAQAATTPGGSLSDPPAASHSTTLQSFRPVLYTALAAVAIAVHAAAFAAVPIRYDVAGPIDQAPQWGPGAFESAQTIQIRRLP